MAKKRRRKKKGAVGRVFRLLLLGLFLYGVWYFGTLAWDIGGIFRDGDQDYEFADEYTDDMPEPPDEEAETLADPGFAADSDRVNVLLIGVDNPGEGSRRSPLSDTIMLLSLHKHNGGTVLLSIPRDTYVYIPGRGNDKINHSHAFGGAALLRRAVEDFLDLPVDYYLRVDFDGFRAIVDMLGGVEIDVPKDMPKYNLQAGRQVLTGNQALNFCRDREDSDYSRVGRQQQFLLALMRQVQASPFTEYSPLIREAVKYLDTDMPLTMLLDFARELWGENPDTVMRYIVPGSNFYHEGVYYMKPNVEAAAGFLNKNLKVPR